MLIAILIAKQNHTFIEFLIYHKHIDAYIQIRIKPLIIFYGVILLATDEQLLSVCTQFKYVSIK